MAESENNDLNQFQPNYAIAPGASLRQTLKAIGMSQMELSIRTGLSLKHVNQIVHGSAPITHDTSLAFEKVTGTPARFWNNLEVNYRDRLARQRENQIDEEILAWLRSLPIRELTRRGYLQGGPAPASQLQQVYRFFGVANRETWERVWRVPLAAYRKSPTFKSDMPALASWLRLGELEAALIECGPFDTKKFRALLQEIRGLSRENPSRFSQELVHKCAGCGVAVVFVAEIKGCRASGAARWLSSSKALIQLSLRHKTDDHFWFSFFHEAGHLLLHGKKETFVTDGAEADAAEQEANRFAETILIPRAAQSELRTLTSAKEIEDFAERIGITPGIVVGRLQRENLLPWNRYNDLKRYLRIVEQRSNGDE
ncbi:MAG: ImmA/IrrE family metallo-endopeptidase [Chloroflexi bacterium]|nr:MAG: ImmA/IrrE family metallo-endopeptidase [Chloroflexota bacterium]